MNDQECKLKDLMALDFKLYDLQLYLNTHPFDKEALALYQDVADEAEVARAEYEEKYGPLTAFSDPARDCWIWIDSPWPWQTQDMCACRTKR